MNMISKNTAVKTAISKEAMRTDIVALRAALIATSVVLLVTGCTSVSKFQGPQGETMVQVNCSGTLRDWSGCYEAIADACPNGYAIVDRQQQAGAFSVYNMDTGNYDRVNTLTREAVAVCKP